ncbi:MAG: type IV secretion system DNA-binding domain-containing protein [Steroidobacteraceae bacterium]
MLDPHLLSDWAAPGWLAAAALATGGIAAMAIRFVGSAPQAVHKRGALVHPSRRTRPGRRMRRADLDGAPVTLGGVALRPGDEAKHLKLIGTTGTGKTTAIHELLSRVLARGDRVVITDPDGGYVRGFHDCYRGDVILNPFERSSPRWDPFAELLDPADCDALARGLIAESDAATGREWRGYARTFLAALLRRCSKCTEQGACGEQGAYCVRGVAELWRLLAIAESDEVRRVVAGTAAQPFLDPDNARMFGSIRSVATSALAGLEHIARQRARPFSVRDWVSHGRGVLFLPYRANQIAALRTLIATWMRLAIFEAMSGPECVGEDALCPRERRLWFVVDELDALGAIDGLKDALARLRKFGGRCVLAFQSIAQVSSTYGAGEAQTIVENCANTLILRCAGSEHGGTSQFASRLIGEREVLRRQISRSRDRGALFARQGSRRSTQVSEHTVVEPAVLPSEVEQLPDLQGFLKTASAPQWRRIRLVPSGRRWRSTISA